MHGTTIKNLKKINFMFEFPCFINLYYIKNQQDATLAILFISNCKITLHVSDMHQWLPLQFLVLLMMDAESVRNM